MGLVEKDALIKALEELTKRMTAARATLAGGDPHGTLAAVAESRSLLAGRLGSSIDRVDAATVVALLGREKARAYADLARLEADARRALGEDSAAARAESRAADIDRAAS